LPGESRFLEDIRREPGELRAILGRLLGAQRAALDEAARSLGAAARPWIAGMGSSFHGGQAIQALFDGAGRPARNADAGELLHFARLQKDDVLLVLSRSGRSVEIAGLLAKAASAGAAVIGVTNDASSPLARAGRPSLLLGARPDANVSVTMYSGVALAGAVAAAMAVGGWQNGLAPALDRALGDAEPAIAVWERAVIAHDWGAHDGPTLLLARGPGLAAALEARQLFEEAAKHPATAHSTGAFRHGPNEVVRPGCRVLLWLPAEPRLRALDLALAADLRRAGANVALVGAELPAGAADLALELPVQHGVPAAWSFLFELMPVRLLVEATARARGVDCDRFDHCPYVVESEEGLGGGHAPP